MFDAEKIIELEKTLWKEFYNIRMDSIELEEQLNGESKEISKKGMDAIYLKSLGEGFLDYYNDVRNSLQLIRIFFSMETKYDRFVVLEEIRSVKERTELNLERRKQVCEITESLSDDSRCKTMKERMVEYMELVDNLLYCKVLGEWI